MVEFFRNNKMVFYHVLFWICYAGLMLAFTTSFMDFDRALIRVMFGISFQVVLAYVNIFWVIPSFLKKKAYLTYFLIMVVALVLLVLLREQVSELLFDRPERPGRGPGGPPRPRGIFRSFGSVFGLISVWGFSTAYGFVIDWIKDQKDKADMRQQQLASELKFLKNQINPHFLFNTLNNLYTLCYMKDDRAAPMVVKLSEMMRYMLQESPDTTVSLEEEVAFLESFIELQQLKTDSPREVTFERKGISGSHRIAPLLLLNFFENSFKHGDWEKNPKGWIRAKMEVDSNNQFTFSLTNSTKPTQSQKDLNKGIGLENTKRRLSLLYPDKHELSIRQEADHFEVLLTLDLTL